MKIINSVKDKCVNLRLKGLTYPEIQRILKVKIPKTTISYWCRHTKLSADYYSRISKLNILHLTKIRHLAIAKNQLKRKKYFYHLKKNLKYLKNIFNNKDVSRIALAMLYLGEGSKTQKSSLIFGNSNPFIIKLFLNLLRKCYNINEFKFRCTLQCRSDQNIEKLERYWSKITKIPRSLFYKARIDARTINRPTKKSDYKGVCRIDYFSSVIYDELMLIPEVMFEGP